MIDEFTALIPESLRLRSGAVFYSGKAAFSAPSPLYILGLNPGGSPQPDDTVDIHTRKVVKGNQNWSEYQDESWLEGHGPGKSGMQPRVLHLLKKLGVDPQATPASNVVFVRSTVERDIAKEFLKDAELCWPFHKAVIERLAVRVILCFGKRAGGWVCGQLGATTLVDEFSEKNKRRWTSRAYKNANGIVVVTATHPSRADWTTREADPSDLVRRMLLVPVELGWIRGKLE